jgi:hypothetical protein
MACGLPPSLEFETFAPFSQDDLSALDRIIGKHSPTLTSSLLKTSPAARIIAQADQVKKAAAKIAAHKQAEEHDGLAFAGTSKKAALEEAALGDNQKTAEGKASSPPAADKAATNNKLSKPFANGG